MRALLLTAALLPASICAAATGDPITAPLLIGTGGFPHVRIAANGDTAVSWADWYANNQMLRWYRANGTAVTAPMVVNTKPLYDQIYSSLAVNANGAAVIGWLSNFNDGGVFVRAYKADKTPVKNPQVVNTLPDSVSYPSDPVVGMFPQGGYVVSYRRFDEATSLTDGLFLRRYAPTGLPLGSELPVAYVPGIDPPDLDGNLGFDPSIAVLTDGQIVEAWYPYGNARVRLFNQYGLATKSYSELPYPGANVGWEPRVAADPRGGFLVAWNAPVVDQPARIVAQHFDASGAALGPPAVLMSGTSFDSPLALAIDQRGNYALVYFRAGGNNYLRIFDANDQPQSGEILLPGDEADVAVNPLGNFAVVWSEHTSPKNTIRLQRFRGVP